MEVSARNRLSKSDTQPMRKPYTIKQNNVKQPGGLLAIGLPLDELGSPGRA